MSVGSLLDEIVRGGARQMLTAAMWAEVAAYVDAHAGEVDESGYRLVVHNGYHDERTVLTAAGAVAPCERVRVLAAVGDPNRGRLSPVAKTAEEILDPLVTAAAIPQLVGRGTDFWAGVTSF